MIDPNSNCSRVDAVKAKAAELRLQASQMPRRVPEEESSRKVRHQLEDVDAEVKHGDARKAETALSQAKNGLESAQSRPSATNAWSRGLNALA